MSTLWEPRVGSVQIHFAGRLRVQYVGGVPIHFQSDEAPLITLTIAGTLPALTGRLNLGHIVLLAVQGTLSAPDGLLKLMYLPDLWEPLSAVHTAAVRDADLLTRVVSDELTPGPELLTAAASSVQAASALDIVGTLPLNPTRPLDIWIDDRHRQAALLDAVTQDNFRQMLPVDIWAGDRWRTAAPLESTGASVYRDAAALDLSYGASIRVAQTLDLLVSGTAGDGRALDRALASGFRLADLLVALSVPFSPAPVPPVVPVPVRPIVFHFGCIVRPKLTFHFPSDCRAALYIPIREWYRVIPDCRLVRLPDRTEIDVDSFSVAVDIGLSLHGLSAAVLNRVSFDRLAVAGTEVELSAQGYTWRFLVNRLSGSRRFAEEAYTLEGMSLARQLGRGRAVPKSYVETASKTLQQLAEQELVNSGWTLSWEAPTWLIPANTWSYERLTTLEAIQALAGAAGAYVHAGRSDESLLVTPRYPVLPWHLADESPDVILPADPVTVLSLESESREDYTSVYVHGTKAGRKSAHVIIADSGGLVAPDEPQTNALLTDYDGLRAFGARYLGDHRSATRWTLELPLTAVDGDVPLLDIGQVIQFSGAGFEWRGIVEAVKVAMQGVELTQTLEVVTYG